MRRLFSLTCLLSVSLHAMTATASGSCNDELDTLRPPLHASTAVHDMLPGNSRRGCSSLAAFPEFTDLWRAQQSLQSQITNSTRARLDELTPLIAQLRSLYAQASSAVQQQLKNEFALDDASYSFQPQIYLRALDRLLHEPNLHAQHPTFKRLNTKIAYLDQLLQRPELMAANPLTVNLTALQDQYRHFQDQLCATPPGSEARRDLLSAISLTGDYLTVPQLISQQMAYDLLSLNEYGLMTQTNATGSSAVSRVGDIYVKKNKLKPRYDQDGQAVLAEWTLNPAMEWAMSAFHNMLFGEGLVSSSLIVLAKVPHKQAVAGSPAVKLIMAAENPALSITDREQIIDRLYEDTTLASQFTKTTKTYIAQVTPEIKGEFLGDFLRAAQHDPKLYEQLDWTNVQGLLLSSLLTNPADAKGDNCIVTNLDVNSKRRIIGIDNDWALASLIIQEQNNYHTLEARNLLFCIEAFMQRPAEAEVRNRFLQQSPAHFLLTWLTALQDHNQRYQHLRTQGLIDEPTYQQIRLKLQAGTVGHILAKFNTLQQLLRARPQSCGDDWLQAICPATAAYYQQMVAQQQGDGLKAFDSIYRQQAFVGEVLGAHQDTGVTAYLDKHQAQKDAYKTRQQELSAAVEELLTVTDLASLSPLQRIQLLETSLMSWPTLLKNRQHAQWQEPQLLHEGVQYAQQPATVQFLAERFATHLNQPDQRGQLPLSYAVQREPLLAQTLVALLVSHGAELEAKDKNNLTALDQVMRLKQSAYIPMFNWLVAQGAGEQVEPAIAQQFYRWFRTLPDAQELAASWHLLEQRSLATGWETSLTHILPNSETLLPPLPALSSGISQASASTNEQPIATTLAAVKQAYQQAGSKALPLTGALSNIAYLPLELIPQLLNVEGQVLKKNLTGNHVVSYVDAGHHRLYFKFYPELPGYEEAVGLLTRDLIRYGAPHTELYRWGEVPVLVSQGIIGETLNPNHCSGKLNQLDVQSLSALLLLTMLINPEDGKPDNYILEPMPAPHTGYRLVGIDNDHAFVPAVAKEPARSRLGNLFANEIKVQVKTILYCLDQMQQSIHPAVRQLFLSFNVGERLENWIRALKLRNQAYRELFPASSIEPLLEHHNCYIGVPFEQGAIERLYDKFVRLQRLIYDRPQLTHLELLCRLEPALGDRYAKAFRTELSPFARFDIIDGPSYQKTRDGRHITLTRSASILQSQNIPLKQNLSTVMKGAGHHQDIDYRPDMALRVLKNIREQNAEAAVFSQLNPHSSPSLNRDKLSSIKLGSRLAALLQDINFATMGEPDQKAVFEALKGRELMQLTLLNANALSDSILQSFTLDKLTQVNLSGCQALTNQGLKWLAAQAPYLAELRLERLQSLQLLGDNRLFSVTPISFPQLQSLNLSGCINLTSLWVKAPLLKSLIVKGCEKLTDEGLDTLIKESPQLESLNIAGASLITEQALRQQYPAYPAGLIKKLANDHKRAIQTILAGSSVECSLQNITIDTTTIGLKAFEQALRVKPQLIKLVLRNNQLGDQGVKVLLPYLINLTTLNLGSNEISDDGATALANGNLTNLITLDLGRNGIRDAESTTLANGNLTNPTTLDSGRNGIRAAGVTALANGNLTNLKSLNLKWNQIRAAGATALANGNLTNLTALELRSNQIGNVGATALANGNLTNLTTLELRSNQIGNVGATALANGNLTNLITLDLGRNGIRDAGATALANGNLTNLITLDLGRNEIGAAGATALADGNLTNLITLDLGCNEIGAAGATALAQGKLTNLTSLDIEGNEIGAAGVTALADGNLTNLITLDLGCNEIGAAGVTALANGNLTNLTFLDIEGNDISSAAASLLKQKIKDVRY